MEVENDHIIITKNAYFAIAAYVLTAKRRLKELNELLDSIIDRCEAEKRSLGRYDDRPKKDVRQKGKLGA